MINKWAYSHNCACTVTSYIYIQIIITQEMKFSLKNTYISIKTIWTKSVLNEASPFLNFRIMLYICNGFSIDVVFKLFQTPYKQTMVYSTSPHILSYTLTDTALFNKDQIHYPKWIQSVEMELSLWGLQIQCLRDYNLIQTLTTQLATGIF